ncbi:MAG: acyl carrier protein [Coriobacteriales bacterium]|jgi:acyl carrier protein|nr:acyl carrier protein [Coriobacteriales bacterium]
MSEASFDVVREVFVSVRGVDPSQVVPEARLAEDLGIDSLDAIEIVMALEDHYGRELDDENLENLSTVEDVVALVQSLVS